MPCEKDILMRRIYAHSFAVDDIKLFLNTHPRCEAALEALNRHLAARLETVRQYEAAFGPLTIDGQAGACAHAWVSDPWPWEKEG